MSESDDTIRRLESERDAYLKALYAMTRNDVPPLTAAELHELQKATASLSDIIAEIEQELGPADGSHV